MNIPKGVVRIIWSSDLVGGREFTDMEIKAWTGAAFEIRKLLAKLADPKAEYPGMVELERAMFRPGDRYTEDKDANEWKAAFEKSAKECQELEKSLASYKQISESWKRQYYAVCDQRDAAQLEVITLKAEVAGTNNNDELNRLFTDNGRLIVANQVANAEIAKLKTDKAALGTAYNKALRAKYNLLKMINRLENEIEALRGEAAGVRANWDKTVKELDAECKASLGLRDNLAQLQRENEALREKGAKGLTEEQGRVLREVRVQIENVVFDLGSIRPMLEEGEKTLKQAREAIRCCVG